MNDEMMNYPSGAASLFAAHVRTVTVKAEDWLERFAGWLYATPTQRQTRRSELTLDAYLSDVRIFARWFEQANGQAFTPELLNSQDVAAYFKQLFAESKPATYNRKLASVRMLVKWAQESGLIEYDPTLWIAYRDYSNKPPRDVDDDEWARLVKVADARGQKDLRYLRDRTIFYLMGMAGLRIHEALELKLTDLHLDKGYIHVFGKGSKDREVMIDEGLVVILREWLARGPKSLDGMVITDPETGRAICRTTGWRGYTEIAEEAGVDASPHAMRHTYINRLFAVLERAGIPWQRALKTVCRQTGDTPQVILSYYTEPRESEIRAALRMM